MIDIVSLSIAIGAVFVSILTHIKHSECWCFKLDTRTPKHTPPNTPINRIEEKKPLLKTEPIDIPKKQIIKNWL